MSELLNCQEKYNFSEIIFCKYDIDIVREVTLLLRRQNFSASLKLFNGFDEWNQQSIDHMLLPD